MEERSKKELYVKIFSEADESVIWLLLVSLISSDNIFTTEDAENSLKEIDIIEEAVKESTRSQEDKDKFLDFLVKDREILHQDIERFKNEQEENSIQSRGDSNPEGN